MNRIICIALFLFLLYSCSKEIKSCFTHLPVDIKAVDLVVFDASCSVGGSYYEWFFGDSTNSIITTQQKISHVYSNPGKYDVQLNVKRKDGLRFKKDKDIHYSMALVVK